MIILKRRSKLFLIIIISILITYFIYFFNRENKINIVSLGDGISSGETSYNIDGLSYNDYLKEYFKSKKLLKNYNEDYSYKNYLLKELLNDLDLNKLNNQKRIKQLIHNASIITIAIGEEELTKKAITNDLNTKSIEEFIINYEKLIKNIKDISESNIFIIGLYHNKYLTMQDTILINASLNNIASKYKVNYIDISDLLNNKDYFLHKDDYYFNYQAHKEIAIKILNLL